MISGALARRYARALIGLATSPTQRDKFQRDMDAFAELVKQRDPQGTQLLGILVADRFPLSQRKKLLGSLLRKLSADPMVGKFLTYVLERDRLVGVVQIARATRRLADEAAGRVRATITSAKPLPPDKLSSLEQVLQNATGQQILAETAVDPELIGGVVTQVGSYVIDGSVRTTLSQIRATLHYD